MKGTRIPLDINQVVAVDIENPDDYRRHAPRGPTSQKWCRFDGTNEQLVAVGLLVRVPGSKKKLRAAVEERGVPCLYTMPRKKGEPDRVYWAYGFLPAMKGGGTVLRVGPKPYFDIPETDFGRVHLFILPRADA